MSDSVKIDRNLLEKIKKLIKDSSKRIKYSSAKQFVNIAVLKLLEEETAEASSVWRKKKKNENTK